MIFCPVAEPLLQIKDDKVLHEKLQSSLTYGFFKKVIEAFCGSVSPDVPPEQNDKKVNVALVCEATSQLVGIHYHPMTVVLGLGTQYLQEKYSTWIDRNMHVANVSVSMTKHLFTTMPSDLITHTNISPPSQGEVSDESKEEVQWAEEMLSSHYQSFSGAQALY